MMKTNRYGEISFRCDTPRCEREINTTLSGQRLAEMHARRKHWAIGTTDDACPEHHA